MLEAHRLVYHSTLGCGVIKKKREGNQGGGVGPQSSDDFSAPSVVNQIVNGAF